MRSLEGRNAVPLSGPSRIIAMFSTEPLSRNMINWSGEGRQGRWEVRASHLLCLCN